MTLIAKSLTLGHLKSELEAFGFRDAELVRIIAAAARRDQLAASGMRSALFPGTTPTNNPERERIHSRSWLYLERGVTNNNLHSSRVLHPRFGTDSYEYWSELDPEPQARGGTVATVSYIINWRTSWLLYEIQSPTSGIQERWTNIDFDPISVRQFLDWIASVKSGSNAESKATEEELAPWIRDCPASDMKAAWNLAGRDFGSRRPIQKIFNPLWVKIRKSRKGRPKKEKSTVKSTV